MAKKTEKKKTEDYTEDKKPEEETKQMDGVPEQPEAPAGTNDNSDYDMRLTALEGKVDQILEALSQKTASDEDDEESEETKADDDESEEEKKTEEGDDVQGAKPEPKPDEGEVKLPKASAGETDETASPETDKPEVKIEEKSVNKAKQILKSAGYNFSRTPRPQRAPELKKSGGFHDTAMELLIKAKKGKLDKAGLTQEIKKAGKDEYENRMEKFGDLKKRASVVTEVI